MLDLDTAIMVGTKRELACINAATDQVTYFNKSNTNYQGGGYVNAMTKDGSGQIWVGSQCGLSVFSSGNWVQFNSQNSILPDSYVSAMHYSPVLHAVLLGFENGNIIKVDNAGWSFVVGTNVISPTNRISSLAADSIGNIWAGTWGNGVYKFNGVDWEIYNLSNSPVTNFVQSLAVDYSGNVWIANNVRISRFNGNLWSHFSCPTVIQHICADTSGTIWASTYSGLYTLTGNNWQPYPVNSLLTSQYLTTHLWTKTNVWTGTSLNGVDRIDVFNMNVSNLPLMPDLFYATASDFDFDNLNHLSWFAGHPDDTVGPVCSYDNMSWQQYGGPATGLDSYIPNAICLDSSNRLWVGSGDKGLYSLQGNNWINFNTTNSGVASDNVTALSKGGATTLMIGYHDGTIQSLNNSNFVTLIPGNTVNSKINHILTLNNNEFWAATDTSGLIFFNTNSMQIFNLSNSGIPSNHVRDVREDVQHQFWIATSEGLAKFNGTTSWVVYNTANSGIADNNITSVSIGNDSSVWIGTNESGVSRFYHNTWSSYTKCNSPLCANEIQLIKTSPEGLLYISTRNGLNVVKIDYVTGQLTRIQPMGERVYPNPTCGEVTFEFPKHTGQSVIFQIYNSTGQIILEKKLTDKSETKIQFIWDTSQSQTPAGIYFYRLKEDLQTLSGKVLVIK